MILPVEKLFKLISLMDDKLKRTDFKHTQSLGVDFSGYRGSFGIQHSGSTKIECILTLVKTFTGELHSYGISNESVCAWLDSRIPDWRKELGVE